MDALCGGPEAVDDPVRDPRDAAALVPRGVPDRVACGRDRGEGSGQTRRRLPHRRLGAPARRGDRAGHGRPGGHAAAAAVGLPVLAVPALREPAGCSAPGSRWSASAPPRSATGRPGPWCAGRRGWPRTGRTGTRSPATRCGRWAWTPRATRSTRTSRSPCRRRRRARPRRGPPGPVCVGVMDFHGGNDDRARAEEIHRRYLDGTTRFVRALVEEGRPVRLLTGDAVRRVGGRRDPRRGGLAAGHRCRAGLAGRPDEGDGGRRHRGGDPLPQPGLRAEGRYADARAQLRGEERRAHGARWAWPRTATRRARSTPTGCSSSSARWRSARRSCGGPSPSGTWPPPGDSSDQFNALTAALFPATDHAHASRRPTGTP